MSRHIHALLALIVTNEDKAVIQPGRVLGGR
jgi:hypothetical protein